MQIKIAHNLSLPADAVSRKFFFAGISGSGKTYAASKFVELLCDRNDQVVVIDPIGNWWNLRLAADGVSPGIKIPVLGGVRGDIPLEPTAGVIVADLISETGSSMVLDISDFTASETVRFVTDFATQLLVQKKRNPSPIMCVWEECQDVVPQNVYRDQARMLGAMQRLIKKGRNFGIGTTLISQRPQAVNKDALNQTECMFAFQLSAPHDKKAISEWMVGNNVNVDIKAVLPSLNKGECLVWSPSWMKSFVQTMCLPKKTYDGSKTPEFSAFNKSRNLAKIDLNLFSDKMKASIEKAEGNDPDKLKKKIVALSLEVSQLRAGSAKAASSAEAITGRNATTVSDLINENKRLTADSERQKAVIEQLLNFANNYTKNISDMGSRTKEFMAFLASVIQPDKIEKELRVIVAKSKLPLIIKENKLPAEINKTEKKSVSEAKITDAVSKPLFNSENNYGNKLPKCERAILTALAQRPKSRKKASREELGALTGYSSHGGGFSNALSALRTAGLITGSSSELDITELGIKALGTYTPLPTGMALIQWWAERLPKAERAIFSALCDSYPQALSKTELINASGYKEGGAFNNALSALRTKELITRGQQIKLQDYFFE